MPVFWKAPCPCKSQTSEAVGKKPKRSQRKSTSPVELLLYADCLDAKKEILLKTEKTDESVVVSQHLQEYEDDCIVPASCLEDPEDEEEYVHLKMIPTSLFGYFARF